RDFGQTRAGHGLPTGAIAAKQSIDSSASIAGEPFFEELAALAAIASLGQKELKAASGVNLSPFCDERRMKRATAKRVLQIGNRFVEHGHGGCVGPVLLM